MDKLNDFELNKRELNMDELEMVTGGGDTIEVIDIFHNNNSDNNEAPTDIPVIGRIKI